MWVQEYKFDMLPPTMTKPVNWIKKIILEVLLVSLALPILVFLVFLFRLTSAPVAANSLSRYLWLYSSLIMFMISGVGLTRGFQKQRSVKGSWRRLFRASGKLAEELKVKESAHLSELAGVFSLVDEKLLTGWRRWLWRSRNPWLNDIVMHWLYRNQVGTLESLLSAVAELDVLFATVKIAIDQSWEEFPEILSADEAATFVIKVGRHPLIPKADPYSICLEKGYQGLLETGPYGGGKSTLLGTAGLLNVLARIGSPVPAKEMRLTVGNLMSQVSAEHRLAKGKSLSNRELDGLLTKLRVAQSGKPALLLLDEVLRGVDPIDQGAALLAILSYLKKFPNVLYVLATNNRSFAQAAQECGLPVIFEHLGEELTAAGDLRSTHRQYAGRYKGNNLLPMMRQKGFPEQIIKGLAVGAKQEYGSQAAGFIQSNNSRAAQKLEKIRVEQRDKLKPAEIKQFEEIKAYLQSKIDPAVMSKAMVTLIEGFDRLVRLYESGKIFTFKAIVYGSEDYALAYGAEDEIGIAQEFLKLPKELLAELLLHEAICFKVGHWQAKRDVQSSFFKEGELKNYLRDFINCRAAMVEGRNNFLLIQAVLKVYAGSRAFLLDKSYSARSGSMFENSIKNLCALETNTVFYGDFRVFHDITSAWDRLKSEHKTRNNLKLAVDRESGLVGVWGVAEELNDMIKKIMQHSGEPVLLDCYNFMVLANLYANGYINTVKPMAIFIRRNKISCSYAGFKTMLLKFTVRKQEGSKKQNDHKVQEEGYAIRGSLRRLLSLLSPDTLRKCVKRYLLEKGLDLEKALYLLDDLIDSDYGHSECALLLWDIYLDKNNTSRENELLLEILVKKLRSGGGNFEDARMGKIREIYHDGEINLSHKATEVLLRLDITSDSSNDLLYLLRHVRYRREVIASFCLLNITLRGAQEMPAHREFMYDHYSPIVEALHPASRSIYYYILKLHEATNRGGALRSDVDERIIRYTYLLDNGAGVPGRNGDTWFSTLRRSVHQHVSRYDLKRIREALYYWKDPDKVGLDQKSVSSFKAGLYFGEIENFSLLLNRMLERLSQDGAAISLEKDKFLDGLLDIEEEEVLAALSAANSQPEEDNLFSPLKKVEYMLRLYYALSERYGTVWSSIIPRITGQVRPDWVEFMQQDYRALLKVIDTDDHRATLSALARCRLAIKQQLLFVKIDETEFREEHQQQDALIELDYQMFLLGNELMTKALADIVKFQNLDDLKKEVPMLAAMAKFILAYGLGEVDFEQFVHELECGSLKYSQVHDLVRAMRTELHKVMRGINENMRLAAQHIWKNVGYHDLVSDWRKVLPFETKIDEWGQEYRVLTSQAKDQAIDSIVDNLIRDSGMLSLDEALMHFNEVLQTQLGADNDVAVSAQESEKEVTLPEQFLRFGQPEIIPRERLLSLWSKKGLNLVMMTEENIPVPPGVIVSARLITRPKIFKSESFKQEVGREVELIRKYSKYPDLKLLLYARSGSAFMLPGLLVTIPNLGMNDKEAEELAQLTGDTWFAYDTYAEFIRSYAIHILGIPEEYFQDAVNVHDKDNLSAEEMRQVCVAYKDIVNLRGQGQQIPETLVEQIMLAVDCIYDSWDCEDARVYRARHRISQEWGTVVILQKGVFGNLNTTTDGRYRVNSGSALSESS
jgi:hypothetical protein